MSIFNLAKECNYCGIAQEWIEEHGSSEHSGDCPHWVDPDKPELDDANLLAAAGHQSLVELPQDRFDAAYQKIVEAAPVAIQDDFRRCCAYYLYRVLLMEAVENGDKGQIFNMQEALLGLEQA